MWLGQPGQVKVNELTPGVQVIPFVDCSCQEQSGAGPVPYPGLRGSHFRGSKH
jgi:hypothetical protein